MGQEIPVLSQVKLNRYISQGWVTVLALWPVAMLNYLDRQMISSIRISMRADIPSIASDQQFAMLMAVFMWVYAILSPVGGFVADRFNRRWMVIGSLFVWSALTWLTAHMNTYPQMLACRALMGISEACYIPAALALIIDFHPQGTRTRAIGIHQSGIYVGLGLGGIGGYIAQSSSWRNCFIWFGMIGVVYAVVLAFILRDPPEKPAESRPDAGGEGTLEILKDLWRKPAFWILVVYFTLPAISGWITRNWLPTFLVDRFGMKEGPAGLSATGYIQIASCAGVLAGGFLADRWMRRTTRGHIYTSALGTLLLAPALVGLSHAGSMPIAIGFMAVFGLGWGFFDCNNMPILSQIAPPRCRATCYGVMNLVSISAGGAATVLLGWMRDQGISFTLAFFLAALIALLSAAMILLLKVDSGVK